MINLIYSAIIITAFLGALLSFKIYSKKKKKSPIVCPLKSNCEAVVTSDFSTLFGIPLEIMGLIYYMLIATSYGIFLVLPELQTESISLILLIVTTGAVLFSIYLVLVQALALREWCTWCLTSAFLSFVIFGLTLYISNFSIFDVLIDYQIYLTTALIIGLILGVGSSLIHTILFIKFLKDFIISKLEQDILKTISQINWIGIIIIVISGVGLYLSQPEVYNNATSFWVKILVLVIIIITEVIINIILTPQLLEFKGEDNYYPENARSLRKIAFATILASLVSWGALLTFIVLPLRSSIPLLSLTFYYLLALFVAIGISQYIDIQLNRSK